MLKASVHVDAQTDVEVSLKRLESQGNRQRLASDVLETLLMQSRTVIEEFLERGTELAQVGSQMRATRTIESPQYSVRIEARFGIRPSVVERLRGLLKRR